MSTATDDMPAIYRWKPHDIPDPDLDVHEDLDCVSPNGISIIREVMNRLLEDIAGELCVLTDSGLSGDDSTSELYQIDLGTRILRSVMVAVNRELGRRVSLVCKRRNSIVPFGKLPVELVGSIFTQTVALNFSSPLYSENTPGYTTTSEIKEIATVSVGWWRAIQSTPAVWTHIGPEPNEVVALKLRKSGRLPLRIVSMPYRSPPIDLLATHSDRWKSAHLDLRGKEDLERTLQHLQIPLPRLESLTLLCTAQPEGPGRLELGEAIVLKDLHLEGILPQLHTPALGIIKKLTLATMPQTRATDVLAIMTRTFNLESLTISRLGSQTHEHHNQATGLSIPVEVPMLTRLILDQPAPSICLALLVGLRAENLSYLSVERTTSVSEPGSAIFDQLTRPNGQIRRSILSIVIVNSSTETIDLVIEDDIILKMTGFKQLKNDKTFHVSLHDGIWGYLNTPEDFSIFSSPLPPVRLILTGTNPGHSDNEHCGGDLHPVPKRLVYLTLRREI